MSNTYFESTGLLHFHGDAKVTPVVLAIFEPLNLDVEGDDPSDALYIARTASRAGDWADVLENLTELADERGLPPAAQPSANTSEDGEDFDATSGLRRLATASGVPETSLAPLLDAARNNDSADVADLFELAMLLQDGHNLRAIGVEGCWHADRPRLGEFGGYGVFRSGHVGSDGNSTQVITDATDLHVALESEDHLAAAKVLANQLARSCRAILDQSERASVTLLLLDQLVEDRSWQSM